MFAAASSPFVSPTAAVATAAIHPHRFEAWESERVELEGLIDRTPETEAPRRKRLLNRCFELETLIFATPCLELPAIRVKARLLLWLMGMEMADGDGLAVMREIHAYLMR
jgi:hypothetical protein